MIGNLSKNTNYIFSTTLSGIDIYDSATTFIGSIIGEDFSSIYATDSFLYIGTTTSGILRYDLSLIESSVFNVIEFYKYYPSLSSNKVNYIHGAGDYLLATTESGVDHYDIVSGDRYYTTGVKNYSKCFQTSQGEFYYVSSEILDSFIDSGIYKSLITLTNRCPEENLQIKIILTANNFDYSKSTEDGRDILFFDYEQDPLSFYIEDWVFNGTSTIWIKISKIGTEYIYMVYGDTLATTQSSQINTFDLFDDFNYPLAVVSGTNYFLATYGNITASGTSTVNLLYDGNFYTYLSNAFLVAGTYVQIEFFTPRIIRQVKIWQDSASVGVDLYIKASNTGAFSGEETVLYYGTASFPSIATITILTSTPFTYYRLIRGEGGSYWRLKEIQMFEVNYPDITTISGSPWVYTSDYAKFALFEDGILTCKSSNNDYIRTDYRFSSPIVVEQKVKLNYGESGKIGYSVGVMPGNDGIKWFPTGIPTFTPLFGGVDSDGFHDPLQSMPTSWTLFRFIISNGIIKTEYEVDGDVFVTSWAGGTNGSYPKAVYLFGTDYETETSIDWMRVRKYNLNTPEMLSISAPVVMGSSYYLNAIYNNTMNWDDLSISYKYFPGDNITINDIFITEGTSTYNVGDNVLFIATSDGVIVVEERKGDEPNSRIKKLKAK